MEKDFYKELNDATYKPITFGIFNKLDDDGYISYLRKALNEIYSVDDFEYYDFPLSDKETFLVKMHNKEYLNNVKELIKKLEPHVEYKVYCLYNKGIVRVVRLKGKEL